MQQPKIVILCLVFSCGFSMLSNALASQSGLEKPEPPRAWLERVVTDAFELTHDGWSTDEVLLHDGRRQLFIEKCLSKIVAHREDFEVPVAQIDSFLDASRDEKATQLSNCLLHLRKRGGILPKSTRRAPREDLDSELLAVAEMAARSVQEKFGHTDSLLIYEAARIEFASVVTGFLQDANLYQARKAALQLRKSRRLEPELVDRIADWKKEIVRFKLPDLKRDPAKIPNRPGVYLFMDTSGYLYIGQAKDLRARLKSHLEDSDRRSLAEYLSQGSDTQLVQIELHVFGAGSPGEDTRIRRAYESELIRTRKPRFNLAP